MRIAHTDGDFKQIFVVSSRTPTRLRRPTSKVRSRPAGYMQRRVIFRQPEGLSF